LKKAKDAGDTAAIERARQALREASQRQRAADDACYPPLEKLTDQLAALLKRKDAPIDKLTDAYVRSHPEEFFRD
jgi:hypothetical protein